MSNVYELINMSDAITFVADSDEVAAITALVCGNAYGAKRDDFQAGPFLFGTGSYFQDEFGCAPQECFDRNKPAVGAALQSFLIGNRASYDGMDESAVAVLMNERRSSMNDICAWAQSLGKKLVEAEPSEV